MNTRFDFVNPRATPFVQPRSRGELPHLFKEGGSYFVTFRLWDAVASKKKDECVSERNCATEDAGETPAPQIVAERCEPPLRLGCCLLARPEIAQIVQDTIRHFDGERYFMAAWVIMPNHVHCVFTPFALHDPSRILQTWKSFSAHKVNKVMSRSGILWERESFDHLIRSSAHFEAFVRYVEDNPVVAGLCKVSEAWPWSSAQFKRVGNKSAIEKTP